MFREQMEQARTAVKVGMELKHHEQVGLTGNAKGTFIIEMWDADTGEILHRQVKDNIITYDAGILAARLFRNSLDPSSTQSNGVTMLAVGTGATGNLLSPDAPQQGQRRLNNEIARKAFSSSTYRNGSGVAVSYPTHIVDFTTVFGESEAVGPLNEMGLMSTASLNPTIKNPITNGPTDYDNSIDVTGKDLMVNYLTFSVVTKPANAVLAITWRLTF